MKILSIQEELAACRKAWSDNPTATWAWCCHHETHIEPLTEPAENRIAYILSNKPENERAIRLRNFRPVRVKLPDALVEAGEAYDKAWRAYDKAREARNKAREARNKALEARDKARESYVKALATYESELKALHDSDWENTWDGRSIF